VPISEQDLKLLWGRAAGRCSRCREDLTPKLQSGLALVLGEMAHDLVAVYYSHANWKVVASWRALLVREIETRVGVAADVSRTEYS
jgi:hypothetical protein